MCDEKKIDSIEKFIQETKSDYIRWHLGESPWFPWFRGEPDCKTSLLPRLYRGNPKDYFENRLLQHFRMRATAYGGTPQRDETDKWLFLARHVGLPTRLLDWTESSLTSLYFALQEEKPIVWMLNPFKLNDVSLPKKNRGEYNIYGLTWYTEKDQTNIAAANINAAWQNDKGAVNMPVAVGPTYVHPRIAAQRSRFTIHGNDKRSLYDLLSGKENVLAKYVVDATRKKQMLDELKILGISRATLFPDLDGLAGDLTELFRPDLVDWITKHNKDTRTLQ
jgi:hypothetical protein